MLGAPRQPNVNTTKKRNARNVSEPDEDEMRPEYDFSKGRPNPYAARFKSGVVAVVLDPDVAKHFPTARAVNDALRAVSKQAPRKRGRKPGTRRGTA